MCLGSDARLLVLTARRNDVQGALMANSTKQLRLTAQAEELSAERTAALNATQWTFNGSSEFDYNTLMNNGYFLVSNDGNNRVVLNQNYYNAVQAANIKQDGNTQGSINGLDNFMQALGVNPPTSENFDNWVQVDNGKVQTNVAGVNADQIAYGNRKGELETAKTNFINTYGAEAPKQGENKQDPIKEKYTEYSYISAVDFAKKLGKANLEGGVKEGGTSTIHDIESSDWNNMTWEKIMTGQQTVLSLGNYTTTKYNYQNDVVSKVHTVIQNLGNTVKASIPSIPAGKVDIAVQKTKDQYKQDAKDYNSGRNYDTFINQSSNSSEARIETSESRDSGTWHHSERRYAVDLKPLLNFFFNELKSAMGSASADNVLCFGTEKERTVGYNHYKNNAGKTYEEWWNAYNALDQSVKNYISEGKVDYNIQAAQYSYVNDEDKATLAKYQRIYDTICSQGWTYNENEKFDKETLTKNLENRKYLIQQQGGKANTMKDMDEFTQVKLNDEKAVEAYYDGEELKIKNQEKRLGLEQSSLQTELSAIETETQSVQSILDKNIERSFNIFG